MHSLPLDHKVLEIMRRAASHGLDIDLLILDYQMPQTSGIDVLREMRSDPIIAKIPVIMLTSVDGAEAKGALEDLRLEASLTKPARSSLMLESIISVISNARGTKPIGALSSLAALAKTIEANRGSAPEQKPKPVSELSLNSTPAQLQISPVIATGSHPALDILVAEDNEMNQMVFTQILETTGFSFKIVENGRQAVENWRKHQPALILMDVSMPEMNGHDATRAIRAEQGEFGTHVIVVGVTAHALNGDRETCFDAGMDDYLPKPISLDSLKQTLAKHLSGKGNREARVGAA